MDHRKYIRIVHGSPLAVLMIHGIAGSPAHFRKIMPAIPRSCSVYNILLDGHGKGVDDFSRTSMSKWKAQVKNVLDEILFKHTRVAIVAHSMGTLFAIQAAIDLPDRIAGLFLLGVPLRPWVRFSTMLTALRVAMGNIRPEDIPANAMHNATSIQMDRRLWKYFGWIPRGVELLAECRRVRHILPELTVPTQCYQSRMDELVSNRTLRDLEKHAHMECTVLEKSGHFDYGEEDAALLRTRLQWMLASVTVSQASGRGERHEAAYQGKI